jgi:16S rRNA processing protein RimM
MASDWLPFGTVGRPHGTRGEIHLRAYSGAPAEQLTLPCPVRIVRSEGSTELVLAVARRVPDGYLVRFDGVADREAAAELSGHEVSVPRQALPPLGAQEFYVEEVVGCDVLTPDGRCLGRVAGTFWNGAQDVMTVVADDGAEQLLPVVAEYVLRLDRDRRQLIVDPHE